MHPRPPPPSRFFPSHPIHRPMAFSTPSNTTEWPSEIATSSPDDRSSPCPPFRGSRSSGRPLPATDKKACSKIPSSYMPTKFDSKYPKLAPATSKNEISEVKVKTEPKPITTLDCSDSANQTTNIPSTIPPVSRTPVITITPAISRDLNRIWAANPSVPTEKSRTAWAEARGLDKYRVNEWFRRKRAREKAQGRPYDGAYELAVDAPPPLSIGGNDIVKQEIQELSIPQVTSTISDLRKHAHMTRSRGKPTCSRKKTTKTSKSSKETPSVQTSVACGLPSPSVYQPSSSVKAILGDDSSPPSAGSKRRLDSMVASISESRAKASKRRKTEAMSIPSDNSVRLSKPKKASKRKSGGKLTKTTATGCRKTKEKNRDLEATAPPTAGPTRLQTSEIADNSGHQADPFFFEGNVSNTASSIEGTSSSVFTANASRTKPKTSSSESSGAELSFGLNVLPQVRLLC